MIKHGAATAVLALALTSLTACGGGSDVDCAEDPKVTVNDAGSQPLKELRLSPSEGDSVELEMRMDTSMSVETDGTSAPTQSIPTITLGMVATVDRVSDDEIEMSVEYDEVDVDGGDAAVESTLASIVGTTATITTDTRGVFVDGDVDPAPGIDSTLESTLDQVEQQFASLTVPLPDEAVGPGAEWEVEAPFELNGLETCNTATYTLTELDGSAYELDVEVDQQMGAGTIEQNGVEAELVEGSSTGTSTTRGDLDLPLAVSVDSDVSSSTKLEVDQGDDTQEVDMSVDLSMMLDERE